ncbi:hypothetical protein EYC84_002694 [Monilinia fructicola]|uniref:Uncharacterized protein n=1 Tax=Monilinia fructicola TaxID=38448 RepID=A0A5M9JU92_MONFR|nr:hypothetical protein EYC84_002694 [Monilinia fructicola]
MSPTKYGSCITSHLDNTATPVQARRIQVPVKISSLQMLLQLLTSKFCKITDMSREPKNAELRNVECGTVDPPKAIFTYYSTVFSTRVLKPIEEG